MHNELQMEYLFSDNCPQVSIPDLNEVLSFIPLQFLFQLSQWNLFMFIANTKVYEVADVAFLLLGTQEPSHFLTSSRILKCFQIGIFSLTLIGFLSGHETLSLFHIFCNQMFIQGATVCAIDASISAWCLLVLFHCLSQQLCLQVMPPLRLPL